MATKRRTTPPAAAGSPLGTGSVATPATPQKPTGYLWDRLEAATTKADLDELHAHAVAQGYGAEGQFMTALAAKRTAATRRK